MNSPTRLSATKLTSSSLLNEINGVLKTLTTALSKVIVIQMGNTALKIKGHMKLPNEISKPLKDCTNCCLSCTSIEVWDIKRKSERLEYLICANWTTLK